jgi:hypothetical protein
MSTRARHKNRCVTVAIVQFNFQPLHSLVAVHVRGTCTYRSSIPVPGEYGITPEATFFIFHHLLIFQKWRPYNALTFYANTPNRATLFLGAPMKSKCVHCFLVLFFKWLDTSTETPPTDLTNQPTFLESPRVKRPPWKKSLPFTPNFRPSRPKICSTRSAQWPLNAVTVVPFATVVTLGKH